MGVRPVERVVQGVRQLYLTRLFMEARAMPRVLENAPGGTPAMTQDTITKPDSTLARESARRRTFAIISHPDAGKTTLTEKLLLYGGAIHLAGSVKARRAARHATSDWMELEQERGISVTSSVLQFDYQGKRINLLDTPGHQDFSEDTYRTLMAADSAVMLLDNRKGVEEQTRKLFSVCKRRRLPIFTFVNKCDRYGESPLQLIDDVEADLGIRCYPVTWPILRGDQFLGVYDRRDSHVHLFEKGEDHGQRMAGTRQVDLGDAVLVELLGEEAATRLQEEIELLDLAGAEFDEEAVLSGALSPTFFGSALTNFGVEPFLRTFLELAPAPPPRETPGGTVAPDDPAFSGFVFKIQANMDPKHRDRLAFVRVCSGRFEAGMEVGHARSGRNVRLAAPQQFMARERTAVEEAWPGDVVGIHDRGSLRIGDTLTDRGGVEFPDIPRFSPEHFARITVPGSASQEAPRQGATGAVGGGRGAGLLRRAHRRIRPIRGCGRHPPVRRSPAPARARVRGEGEAGEPLLPACTLGGGTGRRHPPRGQRVRAGARLRRTRPAAHPLRERVDDAHCAGGGEGDRLPRGRPVGGAEGGGCGWWGGARKAAGGAVCGQAARSKGSTRASPFRRTAPQRRRKAGASRAQNSSAVPPRAT
jgi:peptide chain release factor 3